MKKNIMLIDDDAAIRKSLATLLETYGFSVSCHDSAVAALADVAIRKPDCVLLDVRMPDLDGLAAQRILAETADSLPVIFITGHGDVAMAVKAMKNGAYDFVEKPLDDERLVATIRSAIAETASSGAGIMETSEIQRRFQSLTGREKDVAKLVVSGHSTAAIASILNISPRTVDHHRAKILAKMQATTLSQLMRRLLEIRM
jgi:two-component system response regulator FixJ